MSRRLQALRFFATAYGAIATLFTLPWFVSVLLRGDYADWWQPLACGVAFWVFVTVFAFVLNEVLDR